MSDAGKGESFNPNNADHGGGDVGGDSDATRSLWQPAAGGTAEPMPERIGPYRVLSKLGEGGFGVVYLAEQAEPVSRRVALKIIKPGMDSKAVIARFEQERQALAVMDHPNVARVIDAGTTERMLPFFAMEFVKGEPITDYCDRHNLSIRDRLELFIPVCEAVQHAHMKGIIHRDIKPNNVLVSVSEASPNVKVIDFGVAKALSHTLTRATIFTEHGQLIGTPEYMSPEQAEMGATDIDTRTDVYSLGVLLYELLTGATPFEKETLRAGGYAEIQRIIRNVDPPKPSTRFSSLGEQSANVARHRQANRGELAKELSRELDWVPLKAMRKDRTDRYRTASDLADDIRNYLEGRPLNAGPESATYRLRKFARRNKGPVAALATIILVLILGIIGTTWGMQRALAAEREAEQRTEELEVVIDFQKSQISDIDTARMGILLRDGLIELKQRSLLRFEAGEIDVDQLLREFEESLSGLNFTNLALQSIKASILDHALVSLDVPFADRPLVRARMLQTVASTLLNLGLYADAMAPQEESLDIRRRELGNEHPDTLTSIDSMGWLLKKRGEYDRAESFLRMALDGRRRVLGESHPHTLDSINNIGELLHDQDEMADAEQSYREAIEGRRRILGDEHPDTLTSVNNLGAVLAAQGRLAEAESHFTEVLKIRRRILGDDHPDTLTSINNMGWLHEKQDNLVEAEQYWREALNARREVLGDEHPHTLSSFNNIGALLVRQERLDEAEQYFRRAMEARRRVLGDGHPDTLASISNFGAFLRSLGRIDEAERFGKEAVRGAQRTLSPNHWYAAVFLSDYARTLMAKRRFVEAEPTILDAYTIFETSLGPHHDRTASTIELLTDLYDTWHEHAPALGYDDTAAGWRMKLAEIESAAGTSDNDDNEGDR